MKDEEIQDQLTSIRSLMERSSKFISLSGLSGILAGIYALIGASIAYSMLYTGTGSRTPYAEHHGIIKDILLDTFVFRLMIVALIVLLASVASGVILSMRKAKRNGQQIWGATSRSLLFHMATPLISGGLLIFILLSRGFFGIVAPASLIFYGLALVGASNFTFKDVRYLGIFEIILGLVAGCLPGYGLLFWAIGFGLLHIIYGSIMYLKYDR